MVDGEDSGSHPSAGLPEQGKGPSTRPLAGASVPGPSHGLVQSLVKYAGYQVVKYA